MRLRNKLMISWFLTALLFGHSTCGVQVVGWTVSPVLETVPRGRNHLHIVPETLALLEVEGGKIVPFRRDAVEQQRKHWRKRG